MMRTKTTTAGMMGTVISEGSSAHKKQIKKSNKQDKMKDVRIERKSTHPAVFIWLIYNSQA